MKKLLLTVFFLLLFAVPCIADPRLAWEPASNNCTDSCVDGYRIYQGTSRSHMVFVLAVSSQTLEVPLSSFTFEEGQRYFFAVTAYNSAGESGLSNIAPHGDPGAMDVIKFNAGQAFNLEAGAGTAVNIVE